MGDIVSGRVLNRQMHFFRSAAILGSWNMKGFFVIAILLLALLPGCSPSPLGTETTREVSFFIDELKANGVDGSLQIEVPANDDMEYIATYVISAFTSTRIISFFKFRNQERAEFNLTEAMKNPKLSGQARNGTLLMAATFYPPDEEAVSRIRALFMAHNFK